MSGRVSNNFQFIDVGRNDPKQEPMEPVGPPPLPTPVRRPSLV